MKTFAYNPAIIKHLKSYRLNVIFVTLISVSAISYYIIVSGVFIYIDLNVIYILHQITSEFMSLISLSLF